MDLLARHEKFEMEILNLLNSERFLEKVVFGGGTMLRLCHELNRYSADLDFWMIKTVDLDEYLGQISFALEKEYEITDKQNKYYSLLVEIRSPDHPKRMKIEIRKEIQAWDMEKSIAYSKNSNRQVLLNTHTLEQTMSNKIKALLDRNEVRDAFDIEFLMRKGISIPEINPEDRKMLIEKINSFSINDFKVKLGSLLESDTREYYTEKKFSYLLDKI